MFLANLNWLLVNNDIRGIRGKARLNRESNSKREKQKGKSELGNIDWHDVGKGTIAPRVRGQSSAVPVLLASPLKYRSFQNLEQKNETKTNFTETSCLVELMNESMSSRQFSKWDYNPENLVRQFSNWFYHGKVSWLIKINHILCHRTW